MVDTGLLQPLLPEIYNAIKGDRAQYFWKMLEVLDRTVQAGRKISDAVLLSVLVLPWVVGEIEREEEKRQRADAERSEERRVGKECRAGWSQDQEKIKKHE